MSIIVDLTSAYQWIAWVIHFSEQMYKITYHMHCMYVQMTNQSSANFVRLVLTHILYFYFHLQEIYTPEHSSRTCMGVFICFQTWSWNRTKLEQGGQNYFSVQIKHFAVHFTPHCHYNQNICMLFTRMSCCKASDIYTSVDAHPGTILPILLYSNCFVQMLKLCRVASKKNCHVSSSQDCFSRCHCRPLTTRGHWSITWAAGGTEPTVGNNTDL